MKIIFTIGMIIIMFFSTYASLLLISIIPYSLNFLTAEQIIKMSKELMPSIISSSIILGVLISWKSK